MAEQAPESVPLLLIRAAISDCKSDAEDLASHYNRVAAYADAWNLRVVEFHISFLRGDFEEASAKCAQWASEEPLNQYAAGIDLCLSAYTQDLPTAARKARQVIRRLGTHIPFLSNNAAFVLALAGEARLAERVLSGIPKEIASIDFTIQATRGLIAIAQDQLQEGMRHYRRAAELADCGHRGYIDRARMAINQGLALWLLGITNSDIDIAARAASLPHVDLPADWENIAEFQFLKWACTKAGCPWPPMLA